MIPKYATALGSAREALRDHVEKAWILHLQCQISHQSLMRNGGIVGIDIGSEHKAVTGKYHSGRIYLPVPTLKTALQ